jgi:D-alanyl-D-alanine carboxypeptidase
MSFKTLGVVAFSVLGFSVTADAGPYLVVDAGSGETIVESDATVPWYPASLTKLMTTYVALDAVKQGRLTMDTPLTMSWRAARMAPSKMGFEPGTEVTLDNALKMLMVKSPNDVAVMVAEGVSGSVESFADEMNATAKKLGMKESHFVNPNGLHDPAHYSSARDMAILARALLTDFPEDVSLFDIGALQLGDMIIPNHNGLLGHYPGADGMKTGFTCPAGFNIVASASRDGRKVIAVVMGSPSTRERNMEAAALFERGFSDNTRGPKLVDLPASARTEPKDMRADICSRRNAAAVAAGEEDMMKILPQTKAAVASPAQGGKSAGAFAVAAVVSQPLLLAQPIRFDPVPVFVGPKPGWTGPVLAARPAPGAPVTDATAYTSASAPDPSAAAVSAPLALQGAVKPPTPMVAPKPAKKLAKLTPLHKGKPKVKKTGGV